MLAYYESLPNKPSALSSNNAAVATYYDTARDNQVYCE